MKDEKNRKFFHTIRRQHVSLHPLSPSNLKPNDLDPPLNLSLSSYQRKFKISKNSILILLPKRPIFISFLFNLTNTSKNAILVLKIQFLLKFRPGSHM